MSIAIKRKDYDTPLMNTRPNLYRRHRYPHEIISHCVWLYEKASKCPAACGGDYLFVALLFKVHFYTPAYH